MTTVRDFAPGDRVELLYDATGGSQYATVAKVGRKYVTIALDTPVVGGNSRKMFDFRVSATQEVYPSSIRKVH